MPDSLANEYTIGLEAVRLAYSYKSTPGRSAIAQFGGQNIKKDKPRRRSKTSHQVYAAESRQPQFSQPVLPAAQELTGWIHREIASLDRIRMLWIQYRYRQPGAAKQEFGAEFKRAYTKFYVLHHMAGCKSDTISAVRELIDVAVVKASTRDYSVTPNRHRYSQRNWNKTYKPHWARITQELRDIDQSALSEIGRKVCGR